MNKDAILNYEEKKGFQRNIYLSILLTEVKHYTKQLNMLVSIWMERLPAYIRLHWS